jgi:hypothetical protein
VRQGDTWLKGILGEVAWAISRRNDNYLSAQYHRLVRRRGKLKAAVAAAHSVLVVAYHILDEQQPLPVIWARAAPRKPLHVRRQLGRSVRSGNPRPPVDQWEGLQSSAVADRGLTGRPLLTQILAHHWYYLLRTEVTVVLRAASGACSPLSALVPHPDAPSRKLTGVQVYAPRAELAPAQRHQNGHGTWYRVCSRPFTTNVVAFLRAGDADPWLLLTDLPPTPARCSEYRRRIWEEEGFRDWKSSGWNWQQSRVRHLLEPRSRRCYSYFQLGPRYLEHLQALDQPIPVSLHFLPELRAPVKLS